ncbi:CENP-B 2 [Phytophthora citrophthora]|uniref:CENP-B 2 n=1 Tax=Phytophthora citrophthora TaxID=4793 RepID=A0AAD9LL40_9STRA|nr:CENP-B 2 [Phytophthora citrophthora]
MSISDASPNAPKTELRLYYRSRPGLTHEDVIRWAQTRFSVLLGRSTVGSIIRAPANTTGSLNPDAKRNQEGRFPQMERELYQFVLQSPDLTQLNDLLTPRQLQHEETKRLKLVTVALCCNMDGSEKLEPVVVHNGLHDGQIPPVRLYSHDQALMSGNIFSDWLEAFNSLMEDRQVLLLVDNAPCHGAESTDIELSNVRVRFLPPNSPPTFQPMQAGIIQQFKSNVKTLGVQWMLDQRLASEEAEAKMGLLTAVQHIVRSWQFITPYTIRNCWAHTGMVSGELVAELQQQNVPKMPLNASRLDRAISLLELGEPLTGLQFIHAEEGVPEWVPFSEELTPAPRSRRANRVNQLQKLADGEEKGDDQVEDNPMNDAEALAAALQLSSYAFANRIDVPGLGRLIETTRERCQNSRR